MVAEKKNRPDGEEWTTFGNRQNTLASLISLFAYSVPWMMLLWRWPLFGSRGRPPLSFLLGMGIGWYAVMVLLLIVVVPSVLAWVGRGDLAWRWRGGAIKGAWLLLPAASIGTGMHLPLSFGLRVVASLALFAFELFAVQWLKRKLWDNSR
jgi:hypothetical protein